MTPMSRCPGLTVLATTLTTEVPVGVISELHAAWQHGRQRKEDLLVLEMLPRYENGLWVRSHGPELVEEHGGVWGYLSWCRRQWRCIKCGWLEYQRGRSLSEYGWVRLSVKGQMRLLEARVFGRRP